MPRRKAIKEDSSNWTTSELTERQGKYCHCVLKVAAKNTPECNRNIKEKGGTPGCYNPYSVCAASTGTSMGRKGCGDYYAFESIPDRYLKAFLSLHGVKYPENVNRQDLIDIIHEYKSKKYGNK